MIKRVISMFLCLCMAFTLVGAMVPTASAANQKPLTDQEITNKITEYFNTVTANGTMAYWNAGKDSNTLKTESYTAGITRGACYKNHDGINSETARDLHNGPKQKECASNRFDGITIGSKTYAGGTQCSGFATYMEYVIFQDMGLDGSNWEVVDTVKDDFNFRPGDLVQYVGDGIVGTHTAVVREVIGDSVYFIECNVRKWGTPGSPEYGGEWAFCIIRRNRSDTRDNLIKNINAYDDDDNGTKKTNKYAYVLRPRASLRVDNTTTPGAPSNITHQWTSTGPNWEARISWTAGSGATRYEVEYRTPKTGNKWTPDKDYKSGTSYVSTGLKDYSYYEYRIRACNAGGASDWVYYTLPKTAGQTTPSTQNVVPPPAKPNNVSAIWTSLGATSARVSWSAVSGAESYQVEYRIKGGIWCSATVGKASTSYTFSVPDRNSSYELQVKAVNSSGSSDWAECSLMGFKDIITTILPLPSVVAAPTNVSGKWKSTGSNASAELTWNAVSNVDHYEVGYKKAGGSWVTIPKCLLSTNTSYVFENLDSSLSYSFRIKAVKGNVSSVWAECALDRAMGLAAPSGVSGVWTSTGPKWQARISWNAVSGATRYEVQYRTPTTGNAWRTDADYSSGTSYISTGLGNYNSYDYRVRAVNANGASDWTEYTLFKTTAATPESVPAPAQTTPVSTITPPSAPSGISGVWTSTGPKWQARISWNAVSGATGYEVQYRTPTTGNAWRTDADYASGTSYISTGLGNYDSYNYRVRAVNANGASGWTEYTLVKTASTPAPAQTTPVSTPTPPAPLSAPSGVSGVWTSTGPKWQSRISWNAVSGATGYEVQYRTPTTGNEWRTDKDYSSGTSYISTGLGNYNSYDYRVRAVNANGASDWTEYTLVKTASTPAPAPAATAPAAPTNISGTWTSRGPNWQARISWNAVSGATRYEVQYRTPRTGNEWRTDADYSSGTSYISTGLGSYNSYDYRVRAVNANGASDWIEYTLYK